MKVMKYGLVAASLIVLSGSAFAEVPQLLGRPFGSVTKGFYLGVNAGYSDLNFDVKQTGVTVSKEKNDGFAAGAFGGYQLNENLAAEVGYNYLPKYKNNLTSGGTTTSNSLNAYQIYIAAKGIAPLTDRFNIFISLGAADNYMAQKPKTGSDPTKIDKENLWRPYGAAGLGYYLTKHTEVLVQASAVTDHSFDLTPRMMYGCVGLSYII